MLHYPKLVLTLNRRQAAHLRRSGDTAKPCTCCHLAVSPEQLRCTCHRETRLSRSYSDWVIPAWRV